MPNWCNNTVRITGKNSEIKRIEKAIKEDAFYNTYIQCLMR